MTDNTILNQIRHSRNKNDVLARKDVLLDEGQSIEDIKVALAAFPETHRHSAIILEKELDRELTQFCRDRGITVEVFLEEAWIQATMDKSLLEKVALGAQKRCRRRKQAGNLRRLLTMLTKLK